MEEETDVRHPGDIGGGAGAGDEGRKGADVEDEVWYGVGFFDFILLAGGKVQAPCAVIFRDIFRQKTMKAGKTEQKE